MNNHNHHIDSEYMFIILKRVASLMMIGFIFGAMFAFSNVQENIQYDLPETHLVTAIPPTHHENEVYEHEKSISKCDSKLINLIDLFDLLMSANF